MIELSRHIEALLLEHDCVIVPGLGGFVAQYVPAYRVEEENLFLPPHRSIAFNAGLTLNDGLLIESYMKAFGTTYAETMRRIADTVRDLYVVLQKDGQYELHGIGTLSLTLDGNLHFKPNEAGVITPELYGLSSFRKSCLQGGLSENVPEDDEEAYEEELPSKKKNYTLRLRINRELCNYVAAAVVAVLFYFLWATPVGGGVDREGNGVNMAAVPVMPSPQVSARNIPVKTETVQKDDPVSAGTERADNGAPEGAGNAVSPETVREKSASESDAEPTVESESKGYYTLVLVSCVPEKNARDYVDQLQGKGFKDAETWVSPKMVRVIYGRYSHETEAYESLRRLRAENGIFAEAWVHHINQ